MYPRSTHLRYLPLLLGVTTLLGVAIFPVPARGGGGPMNVIVLYSADDASATEVAKLYEKERDLPPGHLCGSRAIIGSGSDLYDAVSFAYRKQNVRSQTAGTLLWVGIRTGRVYETAIRVAGENARAGAASGEGVRVS